MLYLSRHIVRTKADYYRLLQEVRERDAWEDWVIYMLTAVERTAGDTLRTIAAIRTALMDYKHRIRDQFKFYSQDLINNLFTHPYTKIAFVERDLAVSRLTATKYLDGLAEQGFLQKRKIGRTNYYVNVALNRILTGAETEQPKLANQTGKLRCAREPVVQAVSAGHGDGENRMSHWGWCVGAILGIAIAASRRRRSSPGCAGCSAR